ncbi:MAG: hypothetical protein LBI69_01965 [Puniceicoccales bacterium]|jgi:hypothetical protein|nr:hypothetical protein [Puniceicoccales bacterium]
MTISIEKEITVMQSAYRGLDADMNRYETMASKAYDRNDMTTFNKMMSRVDLLSSIKSSMVIIILGKLSGLSSAVTLGTALNVYLTFLQEKGDDGSDTTEEKSLRKGVVDAMVALVSEGKALSEKNTAEAQAEVDRARASVRVANAQAEFAETSRNTESKMQEFRLRKEERESHGWWWQLFHQ